MRAAERDSYSAQSFSRYLLLWMIVLVLCVVGFLTVNDYLYTKSNFDHEESLLRIQTEQNIEQAIRLKDALWNTYDASLNERMRSGLEQVLQEYERSGGNPERMDLGLIRKKIGTDFDIYIIDESGVITHTTYAPELGMDFKTIPSFYKYLTKIRQSEGFFPDRIVNELMGGGKFRKYAYQPTPDHKYILELGLTGESFEKVNEKIVVNDNLDTIVAVNPYIEKYRIFNAMGRQTGETGDTRATEPGVQKTLDEVIRTRSTLEVSDPGQLITVRYLFIDLEDPMYGSDPSRIIEITYSDQLIHDALDRLLLFHVMIGTAAILMGLIIAFILSRRITRPIQEIASDVEIIARGNLDHRIRPTENREFAILSSGINAMVDSLKTAMTRMKNDEIFRNEMIDQLPVGIFIKKADSGQYIFWNRKSEKLFGIPASEVLGRTDRDIFPTPVVAEIEREDAYLISNPQDVKKKLAIAHAPGERIVHSITATILDSDGRVQFILGICEDVSSENINLKMDLLFSLTRQEILEHLTVIMNHLERAQLKSSPDELQTFFAKTLGSITSIKNQIASMRALQDSGLILPQWQAVDGTFADAIHLLPGHHADIRTELEGVEIEADPLLPRAWYKLLDHSLRISNGRAPVIRISTRVSGETLHIMYQDNSPGIPDLEKESVFDLSDSHGLYLVRELLGYTGITISEIGVAGKGCIFDIRVPRDRFRFT